MSEPVNALAMDKDKPPACSCGDLGERVEALEERLDTIELHLALRGRDPERRGLFPWLRRKRAIG